MPSSPEAFSFSLQEGVNLETLSYLAAGLGAALQPLNLLYCFFGVFLGTLVGVLPGIGPAGAVALLLPVTFHAPPLATIIMLCGIMYGTQYGGSTTSILVNIPGEASSVVTCIDGYAMARKGRAGPALGMAAFGSFLAGTLCIFGLVLLAPPLAAFSLRFGPPEYFALMAFGLITLIFLARESMAKALMVMLFGLILSSVGLDLVSGFPRFTFNILTLRDGLGLPQVVIGLYGVSEVLLNLERSLEKQDVLEGRIKGLFPNLEDWKNSIFPIARSTVLGFFLGIIPGMGVTIPTFIAYSLEKKLSRHPEKFGTGIIEGVATPEAANNAAMGGAMVPLLSLGIPTGPSSAMVLGALMIFGITPGPLLIKESPQIFWGVVGSMYIGNAMLLALNLPLIGMWVRVLRIPPQILFSLILFFCLIGAYSANGKVADMVITIIFGLVGYLMKKFNYETAPFVLGFVLGPLLESAFRRSMILSKGRYLFIFFRNPICIILMGLTVLVFLSQFFARTRSGEHRS